MKNVKLEFIRGFAAVLVFICHIILTNPVLKENHFLNIIGNWGTEAVILFFILSGIVINITQKKKQVTAIIFLKNRFLRIYPLYIIGLAAAAMVMVLFKMLPFNPLYILGDLLFLGTLQNYIVPVPAVNPVMWSLAFEMFFYVIYAFSIGKYQKKMIAIWFIIALLCIPFYYLNLIGIVGYFITMLSFSSIWLIGYYIYEYRNLFVINNFMLSLLFSSLLPGVSRLSLSNEYYDVFKFVLFAIASVPLFIYCLNNNGTSIKNKVFYFSRVHAFVMMILLLFGLMFFCKSLLISKVIYIGFPISVLVLSFIKPDATLSKFNFLKKTALFMGTISYSLYIIHFPVLILLAHFLGIHYYSLIFADIIIVLGISTFFEFKYQRFIVNFFRRKPDSLHSIIKL